MKKAIPFVLALLMLGALAGTVEAAGFTLRQVRGDLAAPDDGSSATGRFALTSITSGSRGAEKLLVFVGGLDVDAVHEVVLGEDVEAGALFGEIEFRGSRGYGVFRFSSARDEYPADVTSLADFSGAKVFVVAGGETVLEGVIPGFVDPDSGEPSGDSFAVGAGLGALTPPSGSGIDAVGMVTALAVNVLDHPRERLAFRVVGLDTGTEYGVYLTLTGGEESFLGSFTARGWFGIGKLVLDTSAGDVLPDHIGGLAGLGIEVRDGADAVLTGTVPSLK